MQNRLKIGLPILLLFAVIAAVFGLFWGNNKYLPKSFGQADFTLGWTASYSWLIRGGSPYDSSVINDARTMTGISQGTVIDDPAFIYPLFGALFYSPFTLVNFQAARVLWLVIIEIVFIFLVVLSIRLTKWRMSYWETTVVVLLMFIWFNGASSLFEGKFDIIIITLLIGALLLILEKQDVGAGFLLALSTVRLDISLLLVIYILVWSIFSGRHRLFLSTAAGLGFMLTTTILLLPEWPIQWLRTMVPSVGHASIYRTALSLIARAFPGISTPLNYFLHGLVIIMLLISWGKSIKKDKNLFLWTAAVTLAVTNLVGYRINTSYTILLLPCLFLIFRVWQDRWEKGGKIAAWIALSLIIIVSWLYYFTSIRITGNTPASMYLLPPLMCIIGLIWIRWWAIRSSRMPLDLMRERIGL